MKKRTGSIEIQVGKEILAIPVPEKKLPYFFEIVMKVHLGGISMMISSNYKVYRGLAGLEIQELHKR